jgi:hypothetical protein
MKKLSLGSFTLHSKNLLVESQHGRCRLCAAVLVGFTRMRVIENKNLSTDLTRMRVVG